MGEILSLVAIFAGLVGVLFLSITGGRGDRAGHKDPLNRLGAPTGEAPLFVLGALAIGQLFFTPGVPAAPDLRNGALIGIILGLTLSYRLTKLILGWVGIVAAVISAWTFVAQAPAASGMDGAVFRAALMGLVASCFILGAGLASWTQFRSPAAFAFGHGRGLAFFGLIDITQFFASPAGLDLLGLQQERFYIYLGLAMVCGLLLGFFASQFTLYVTAAAVTAANVLFPLAGFAQAPAGSAAAVVVSEFFVAACVFYAIARIGFGKLRRRSR